VEPGGVEPLHVLGGGQLDLARVFQELRFLISSVLYSPIADSISALSRVVNYA
jgi:hypothetical protein